MDYRYLGNSGLKISEITYGNWLTHGSQVENDMATQCVRAALDAGITTFDTADVYANTKAETVLGEALKGERRESLEIFTKVYWPTGPGGKNDTGLSRKHIMESINGSLARLQTDYVDLYQAHRYDTETPLEETMQAFADVVRQGKALYIGVSEWTADQIREGVRAEPRSSASSSSRASRSTRCCGASSRTRSSRPARSSASARSCGARSRRACSPASTSRASAAGGLARHRREGRRRHDQAVHERRRPHPGAGPQADRRRGRADAWPSSPSRGCSRTTTSRPRSSAPRAPSRSTRTSRPPASRLEPELMDRIDEVLGDVVERDPGRTTENAPQQRVA